MTKLKLLKKLSMASILLVGVVVISGCKDIISNVSVSKANPIISGDSVVIGAQCNSTCANVYWRGWSSDLGSFAINPDSCVDITGGNSKILFSFKPKSEIGASRLYINCENKFLPNDYNQVGINFYVVDVQIALTSSAESLNYESSTTLMATIPTVLDKNLEIGVSSIESNVFSYPSGSTCVIPLGQTSCTIPVKVIANSPQTAVLNASALNYAAGSVSIAISPPPLAQTPNMFLTAMPYDITQMINAGGADSLCNTDSNKLTGYTYKAFLATATTDIWVNAGMKPNTTYYRTDLTTPVLTTDALGEPPTANWTNNVDSVSFGQQYWSGQVNSSTGSNTNPSTCNSWTDTSAGSSTAIMGIDDNNMADEWNGVGSPGRIVCSGQSLLMCVSQ